MRFAKPLATIAVMLAALAGSLVAVGCGDSRVVVMASAAAARSEQQIARGQYLVNVMGCHDCHTPLKMGSQGPEPDMTRALSGHPEQMGQLRAPTLQGPWLWSGAATNTAFAGPWGVSYAVNLTPDQNTGLGIWTEDMFMKAIRTGRHMGVSRPILPPMPWTSFRNASDEDLKAVFAYLRSLQPIVNHVPDAQLAELQAQ